MEIKQIPLSYNSFKCFLQAKSIIRENSVKKNILFTNKLSLQTPSTGFSDKWANKQLDSVLPLTYWMVKFMCESPKSPCVLQCAQGADGREIIFGSLVFLEANFHFFSYWITHWIFLFLLIYFFEVVHV